MTANDADAAQRKRKLLDLDHPVAVRLEGIGGSTGAGRKSPTEPPTLMAFD